MEEPCIFEGDHRRDESDRQMTSNSDLDSNDQMHDTSGARNYLHGVMYQLKHLMLIFNRVRKMGYAFRLATEMDTAEKFDDLVLEYQDSHGNRVHRFVQMKHKQNDTKPIGVDDLFADEKGDFSLIKYFISWRKVKRCQDFAKSKLKYFILCTNVGIDVEALENKQVTVIPVKDRDDFLIVKNSKEQPPRYKLKPSRQSELYAKLESASDVRKLAKALAECVTLGKEVTIRTEIFKQYESVLTREVLIHTEQKKLKFHPGFIENDRLSPTTEKFRDIFVTNVEQFFCNKNLSTTDGLEKISLKTSAKFGQLQPTKSQVTQPNELPDDEVTDDKIFEFFDEFILAVNQPNEEQLGELISQEFGECSGFNLLNTNLTKDSFQRVILNWFKTKAGRFLVRKDAEEFFNEMEHELSSLITVGLNLSYLAKLRKYNVKFEKEIKGLQEFLDSSESMENLVWHLTSSGQTLLTALRIHQTVEQAELYKQEDSFIFIELENLLQPVIEEQVFRAFQSPLSHNLLVVDCGLISSKQDRIKLYERICGKKKILSKRIILIIPQTDDRAIRSKVGYRNAYEACDDTSIDDVERSSLRRLLGKRVVKFQGRDGKMSFEQLLGTEMFDNAEEGKLKAEYRRIIGTKTLVKLIIGDEIRAGNSVQGLGEVGDYFIPRTIDCQVVIKSDIISQVPKTPDMFAICGIVEEDLAEILQITNSRVKTDSQLESSHRIFREKYIILENSQETEHFDTLCRQNPNRNIHWLQAESKKFIWVTSFGTVKNLIEYRVENGGDNDDDVQEAIQLTDDQLAEHDERRKIVIISDTAGMGKSTVLTNLARKIMENEPSLLVIKVNLTEHTKAFDTEQTNPTFDSNDTNGAINFLVDKLVPNLESEETMLLKMMIKASRKAALLFDGFDEISPNYTRTAIDLLQALAKLDVKKLFVTTRPHTSRALEEALGVFAHTLQPFSEKDQVDFLTKFWNRGLRTEVQPETDCEESLRLYAQAVIELLTRSIDQSMKEFTGVPLQTRLVAESFSSNRAELPETINIIELYRLFVDKKYQIFMTEKGRFDPTNLSVQSFSEREKQRFLEMHQKFALELLFDRATVGKLLRTQRIDNEDKDTSQDISENRQRTGIVTSNSNGKLQFIHRTFAEYFAAEFLVKTLINHRKNLKARKFIMEQFFVRPEYQTTRAFTNGLLACQNNVFKNKAWYFGLIGAHRAVRLAFDVAVEEQNFGIVQFFANVLKHCSWKLFSSWSGRTLLHLAVTRSDLNLVTLIVKKGGDIESRNDWGNTLLCQASYRGQLDVVKHLLQIGANIEASGEGGQTSLSFASENGELSVVIHLLEKGANIEARDKRGRKTPLISASRTGQLSVVNHLLEKGANIEARDIWDRTPLCSASENGELSVVIHLIEKGANIEAREIWDRTPLSSASKAGKLSVVIHLLENGANIEARDIHGWTPLCLASENGQLSVVIHLTEKGADIENRDEHGWMPLRFAAEYSHLDVIDHLLENGANIDARDDQGWTPLCSASEFGRLPVVIYLLENGANIEARGEDGWTPLRLAVEHDHLDVTDHLLKNGADIEIRDQDGQTPLIEAISRRRLSIVELLLQKGANTEAQDAIGQTPLRLAVRRNQFAIVKRLLEKGANIEAPEEHGYTPLHLAVQVGNLDIVQHLIHCGANINSQTNDGFTPLRLASRLGNSEVINYLIQKGAR